MSFRTRRSSRNSKNEIDPLVRKIPHRSTSHSRVYAQRMVSRIRRAVEHVRLFPKAAPLVAEWGSAFREIYVGNYRVIYQLQPKTIDVVTIIHAARQLPDPPDA